jgi:hypothetical protein
LKSPFETLGLLPSLVGRLDESQLQSVVKETGKALQFIFHPDRTGGDEFRSTLINEATRSLGNVLDTRDSAKQYLAGGPGQREIEEAENELLTLHSRLAALEENISKTEISGKSDRHDNEVNRSSYLIESAYSEDGLAILPVEIGNMESKNPKFRQAVPVSLRQMPGTEFLVASDIQDPETLQTSLELLEGEDKKKRESEAVSLRRMKGIISDYKKEMMKAGEERRRELEGIIRKKEEDIEYMHSRREARTQEIKEKRVALRKAKSATRNRRGKIAQDGSILISRKNTGFMVVGSSDIDGAKLGDMGDSSAMLKPCLVEGNYLMGINEDGKLNNFGIIQAHSRPGETGIPDKAAEEPVPEEKKRSRVRKRKPPRKQEIPVRQEEPQTIETGLVRRADTGEGCSRNPFEKIGILPSLVRELKPEDLVMLVQKLSKSLLKVLHPDAGGDRDMFVEVSKAAELLEGQEVFEKAREEYAGTSPGAAKIAAVERMQEEVREKIVDKVKVLAKSKSEAERRRKAVNARLESLGGFWKMLLADIYGTDASPADRSDAVYLRRSAGARLSISVGDRSMACSIRQKGFDVFAAFDRPKAMVRLLGSAPPGEFETLEQARDMLEAVDLRDSYLHVHPVLYEKGYLVAVKDNRPEPIGMIESIERGKAVAKKMGKGLKDKRKPAGKRRRRPNA